MNNFFVALFTEPYDQETWGMILVVAVHSAGFFILLYDYLSPAARDRYKSRSGQISYIATIRVNIATRKLMILCFCILD